ncbi:hypothetical protein GIB67_013007 [Kingdonia uniflora]|uniref:KIB1-4 beta-propeller domain-containing protein n=1 Tax=Kingdonia uniflora TaxID=39325 RepID=A0A7J7MCP8_9MAGN|nr:hypothetical protein GIB67_013007 [Kingdonia uniflora]
MTSNCYSYRNFELRYRIKLRDSNSQRSSIQFNSKEPDEFYAVTYEGEVVACDIRDTSSPKGRRVAHCIDTGIGNKKYLVESLGRLLLVIRDYMSGVDGEHYTIGFKVLKLNPKCPNYCLRHFEVNTLQGQSIFLSNNSTFSVSPLNFPESKPNCIYFTDDGYEFYYNCSGGPYDLGIFNVEKGILEPNPMVEFKGIMPPPMWVEPTLLGCVN